MILRFLLERVFTEDRPYPEKEVNQRLALFHRDVAALRRYLYDERFVDRDHGVYVRRGPATAAPGSGGQTVTPALAATVLRALLRPRRVLAPDHAAR